MPMNDASPAKLPPLSEVRYPLERSLLAKLEALKDRLDNFTVADAHGEPMGEIRNLVLYKRRLHLVIVQPDIHKNWRFVLLGSHLVQQVSLRDRTIFVRTTHTDASYLPEQRSTVTCASLRYHANAHASVMSPVSQLPALVMPDRTQHLEAVGQSMVLLEPIALKTYGKVKVPLLMESSAMPKTVEDVVDGSVERSPNFNREINENRYVSSSPVITPARPVTVRVNERMS